MRMEALIAKIPPSSNALVGQYPHFFCTAISDVHIAVVSAQLPIYAHLFGLRH